ASDRQLLMVTAPAIVPRVEEERYLALLRASNAIATCSDCSTASDTLIKTLRDVTTFDCLHLVAFDKDTNASTWSVLEANGEIVDSAPDDLFLEDSPFQWVHDQLKLILDLNNQVVSNLEFQELLRAASASVRQVMHCDAAAVMLVEAEGTHLRVHALDYPESRGVFTEGSLVPINSSLPG